MGKESLIAVAGKGGTGKTTVTALLLRYLSMNYKDASVLAVDADANANLNEALGLEVEETISEVLEATKDPRSVPSGMSKDMFMDMRLNQIMVESESIDLLVMGNPVGPGCYCFPNELLRKFLEQIRSSYDFITVDNEAGMEHLSRRIIENVDHLIITSDSTAKGVRAAGRAYDIVNTLNINCGKVYLVITRTQDGEVQTLQEEIDKTGLELLGVIPMDEKLSQYDLQGKPIFELPDDSPAVKAVNNIAGNLNL